MPSYSNTDLLAVSAIVIPAGSIFSQEALQSDYLLVWACGLGRSAMHVDDTDDDVAVEFTPPDGWKYDTLPGYDPDHWYTAKVDLVGLSLVPFGDRFGAYNSGLQCEIDAVGTIDVFQDDDFAAMADLAIKRLAEHKATKEYSWGRQGRRHGVDPDAPLEFADHTIHLVLACQYTVDIDDYNHEADVVISFEGEVDLGKLVFKGAK